MADTTITFVACPDSGCGQIAEVADEVDFDSTDGPVRLVRTRCVNRHIFDTYDRTLTWEGDSA